MNIIVLHSVQDFQSHKLHTNKVYGYLQNLMKAFIFTELSLIKKT